MIERLNYCADLQSGAAEKRLVYGGNQPQVRSNGMRITLPEDFDTSLKISKL